MKGAIDMTSLHRHARRAAASATLAGLLALGASAPAALAGQPARAPLFIPGPFEFPAGAACAFDVRLDILVNEEVTTTFTAPGTEVRILTTGRLIVGLTNEATGREIDVNISGPGWTTVHADGSSTLLFLGEGLPFVDGALFVSSGPVIQELAPDGSIVSTSAPTGHARDMCAALST